MPRGYPGTKKGVNVGAMTYAKLIRLLEEGRLSTEELAEQLGLHYLTVIEYLNALYKENVIHIHAWRKDNANRSSIRIYILGGGLDAKKPVKSRIQIANDYRERKRLRQLKTELRTNHGTHQIKSIGPFHQL